MTFAFSKLATVMFVTEVAPPEKLAFYQSFASAVKSAAYFVGVLFGGVVMETFGSRVLYGGASILVALSSAVYGLSFIVRKRKISSRFFELVPARDYDIDDDAILATTQRR